MGDTLILYLRVSHFATSLVMVKDERGEHNPIYYMIKFLWGAKIRYSIIEKFAYVVVIATRKMKPYF